MGTKKDKILEKLRKLMNLKESAQALGNEGEANAAAAGITRLLMEYNLTEEDIPEQEKLDNPIVSEEIPFKAEMSDGKWYSMLISVLCDYNMCRSLIILSPVNYRMRKSKFQIIGRKKNVEVVLYLISFLSHQFVFIGKRQYPDYKYKCLTHGVAPKSQAIHLKSFLYGCVIGLDKKLKESKATLSSETNITALVHVTTAEIDDFLKGVKIGKARKESTPKVDALSVMQGVSVGHDIEISKGVHASKVSEDMYLN